VVSSCSTANRPPGRNNRPASRATAGITAMHPGPEHGVWRIVVSHFGFELGAIRNVGRVGHHEIDVALELGQHTGAGDVRAYELHRGCRRRFLRA